MSSSERPTAALEVVLRPVADDDVDVFFRNQLDAEASEMAAFESRQRDGHFAHWDRILSDETVLIRTIVLDGRVAGNVVSWSADGRRLVGYWIGKEFWGRGVATVALRSFLEEIPERPLHAYVAAHNLGSIRVLEKCGFIVRPEAQEPRKPDDVEELLMKLPPEP